MWSLNLLKQQNYFPYSFLKVISWTDIKMNSKYLPSKASAMNKKSDHKKRQF